MGSSSAISAAVLAGGQSRRMGTDKALLDFRGHPLLRHILDVLCQVADDVFIVGDRPDYHLFGAPVVADQYPDAGTLGGIATAIQHAHHQYVFVAACDMPFLDVALIEAMSREELDYDVLVPATASTRSSQGGRLTYETLHAIYSRNCLTPIEQCIEQGRLRVVGFFDSVRVRMLDERWISQYDPNLRSFMNTNTAVEFEEARRLADMNTNQSVEDAR